MGSRSHVNGRQLYPGVISKNDHPIDVSMSNDMITNTCRLGASSLFWCFGEKLRL